MSHSPKRLILFTRYPVPGQTKTRLIPSLGAEGAASLQRRLTLRALRAAAALPTACGVDLQIYFDGASESVMKHWLGSRFTFCEQPPGDLGQKMAAGFADAFRQGCPAIVLIGADCPGLSRDVLAQAFEKLRDHPVVLGPATDGGYYLIGLRVAVPRLFTGMPWGTDKVLTTTLQVLERAKLNYFLLHPLDDIDRPEDLAVWRNSLTAEDTEPDSISVVIPALNEANRIRATVSAAAAEAPLEIVVVDGGSQDMTISEVRAAGAMVVSSEPGRARQMNAGAAAASGKLLLFLHADTMLPKGYSPGVLKALSDSRVAAGAYRFGLADEFPGRKLIEWTTNLRSVWLRMPYGDQGLFLRRAMFEELGGFADLPILEDYELVRRLRRRGRVVTIAPAVRTSGRRWQRLGCLRTTLINKWVITGYRLGWPTERLAATYRKAESRGEAIETRGPKQLPSPSGQRLNR